MGLLQKAIETYDAMEGLAGVYEEGREPLAPVGHIATWAHIEVTITPQGRFVGARTADREQKIIIPVTEDSAGRTSAPAAHPLCEQLGYLSGRDAEKLQLYLEGLEKWVKSAHNHPKAAAVWAYVSGRTLLADLASAGLSAEKEKDMICWRVVGLGTAQDTAVWKDKSLMNAYTAFYLSQLNGEKQVCMLTGQTGFVTWKHMKGAFSLNGNAKIISANDSANFTYRGRFEAPEEAASVSYLASQKAHNALKWLISTQGTIQGNQRAFVCWNPRGIPVPKLHLPFLSPENDEPPRPTYRNYRDDLRRKLTSCKAELQADDQVIIAAFDAATTGRLAITYYNELLGSDFLDRLAFWDETCCWYDPFQGVHAPALYSIICFAFGTERGPSGKIEPDDKLAVQQMQRLLSCRIDQAAFPLDIMQAIVTRAGNLQSYGRTNRHRLVFTACAVIRKYHMDHEKEELELALEPERKDRSYQWGRLLAVMEKIEQDTYDRTEDRQTNAIRMQSVFVQRPGYAAKVVLDQLKTAYYPRLSRPLRIAYDRLIGEIMEQLSLFDAADYGKPLTETYLPGYYLQKNALYARKNDEIVEEE